MTNTPPPRLWKVGDLAEKTGLSVRTLHYYEEIGLLRPSHRTPAGHRLYTHADIRRLSHIKSLRQLGFSLEETQAMLDDPRFSPLAAIERHLARLREQVAAQKLACARLQRLASALRTGEEVGTDELFQTIEAITMYEKYFSTEQLNDLNTRRQALGDAAIREHQQQWVELIEAVRREQQAGTDPKSDTVQALARRWRELVAVFSGGDAGIEGSLQQLYRGEPEVRTRFGLDEALVRYISQALH